MNIARSELPSGDAVVCLLSLFECRGRSINRLSPRPSARKAKRRGANWIEFEWQPILSDVE